MTITSRTEQPRQPAGVPVGGQFATATRAESATVLLDPSDASHADQAIAELSEAELIAAARQSVRTHAYRQGVRFVGEDDMVQETIEKVLQYKRNNEQVIITRPYVHTVGAGIVAQAARGRLRAEDRKAIGIFNRRKGELEEEMGRPLTPTEQDQLAAQIRESWHDPRHRPSADFVALAQVRVLSLDATVGSEDEGGRSLADTLSNDARLSTSMADADDLAVDPDTMAGQVLSGARADRNQNRVDAWDIYAEMKDLPTAQAKAVSPRHATAHRARVADAGGVCAAARTWLSGEDSPATEALFAPFGALDMTARDQVAEALLERSPYAEELWAAAMAKSSRRRPGE